MSEFSKISELGLQLPTESRGPSIWYDGDDQRGRPFDRLPRELNQSPEDRGHKKAIRHDVAMSNPKTDPVKASPHYVFTNAGRLQDWHPGAGYTRATFFTDEVRIME